MAVKTVSVKKLGKKYKISPHFTLDEFRSRDGADTVLYSEELLAKLEELRAYVGGTVGINSGYRSAAHNKKVGGATNSKHTQGYAADIVVKKDGKRVSAKLICCLCQTLGFKGIGLISDYATHVDMRPSGTYRGDERKNYGNNVGGDFYKYFGIKKSQVEALKAVGKDNDVPAKDETVTDTNIAPKKDDVPETNVGKKEDEAVYKKIDDVPAWAKDTVKKMMALNVCRGTGDGELNITATDIKTMCYIDRYDTTYLTIKEVPEAYRPTIQKMIEREIIKGTGDGRIDIKESQCRTLVYLDRIGVLG